MKIGIPKEIKNNENRVAITPAGVMTLVKAGHDVYVETEAGAGSGFSDSEYEKAGAVIVPNAEDAWAAEMVLKVKEPLPEEFRYFRPGLILFTYLHLAAAEALTKALVEQKVVGIAYETVQLANGSLPLLTPMSEVAGRMSVQAGTNAAKIAVGLGADVTILDINAERLRELDDLFGDHVTTLMSNSYHIAECVRESDLVVGAVLIPGAKAPKLVTEEMVRSMTPGSVLVDVAIDQGGIFETTDRVTTHDDPTYVKHGVVHYAVANMPGAVPRTSTFALTNVTIPYALQIANKGYRAACLDNPALLKGINTLDGHIVYEAVAAAHNMPYTDVHSLLHG
ncbi:alanine dehydrogenase [Geobacillus zalihae]|uniref:alanine dehydrogenase n=1 Tax=Geobacillus zalihae TaxID=213419 RepID=UPI0009BCA714|nr:alanine dehydrogenase [Geobacillus zalihae]OQP23758.1 alanine dehydrogenase [Geobacillus zalihae]